MPTERPRFTQNRELSWLKFNDRVLAEAMDETVPLLERLKFISIFTSNLDEFFMIRVGSLYDLTHLRERCVDNKSGMTPQEQLERIYAAVRPLYTKRDGLFFELERQLRAHGVYRLAYRELEPDEQKFVRQYYKTSIQPILSPQIVDTHHPFPHLQNKVVHIGAMLRRKNHDVFALLPVPASLPDVIFLPGSAARYIAVEDVMYEFADRVFDSYSLVEKVQMCITRNGDIHPDDEAFDVGEDFRKRMKKALGQRRRLAPVRLELSRPVGAAFSDYLCAHLGIFPEQIYTTAAPIRFGYVFSLSQQLSEGKRRALTYPAFTPQQPARVNMQERILHQVQKQDLLLHYPYERMEPFLKMVREASADPAVLSIQITIYRLAGKSKLVEYLCAAAENGKDVTVLIELRARFDEANNIDWSEQLEAAGCTMIYGIPDYKVHSKICLITRREHGAIRYYTQVGTGNYNEKTAALYTDLSLLTANQDIGRDAKEFFKNMAIGNLHGQYGHLLVAPVSLKERVLSLIDREIAKRDAGRIFLKFNSLTDMDLIEKLKQASCAGVRIRMIIRGICCIVPGIPDKTAHIEVRSVVGRFLEHSRIYCFGEGADEQLYLSSADFMTRNTERRVEVACPIYSDAVRDEVHRILDTMWQDTVKARVLQPDGSYARQNPSEQPLDCQQVFMERACAAAAPAQSAAARPAVLWPQLHRFLARLSSAVPRKTE